MSPDASKVATRYLEAALVRYHFVIVGRGTEPSYDVGEKIKKALARMGLRVEVHDESDKYR